MAWSSKKQPTIYLSYTNYEYKALYSTIYEVIWPSRVLEDAREVQKTPIIIKCDNQSTIKLANNLVYHAISKHIETRYHFIGEKMHSKEIGLIYCNIYENIANTFTKLLGKANLKYVGICWVW